MVDHRWQHDYTGPCDLKIKSKLFILSGFWNSTFKCFHPETPATLSLQGCVAQPGAAVELLAGPGAAGSGEHPGGCDTLGIGAGRSHPSRAGSPADFGSLAQALTPSLESKTFSLVFSPF